MLYWCSFLKLHFSTWHLDMLDWFYCIVSIHLYSASCSAHQSEALPVWETQREESRPMPVRTVYSGYSCIALRLRLGVAVFEILGDLRVTWFENSWSFGCDLEVKFMSNDYTNPNTNPKTLTTLTLTLTDHDETFEKILDAVGIWTWKTWTRLRWKPVTLLVRPHSSYTVNAYCL